MRIPSAVSRRRYVRRLVLLVRGDTVARLIAFGIIGVSGLLPNLGAMWLLTRSGLHYLPSAVVATQVAIVWNFLLVELLLHHRRQRPTYVRFGAFLLLNNADLALRIPLLAVLVEYLRIGYLVATAITVAVAFGARFLITDRLIYVHRRGGTEPQRSDNQVVEA